MPLDTYQRAAVESEIPRILVRAGAGSGKTRTLVARCERLITSGWHPAEILALTFTRKAAAEMRERLVVALGSGARRLTVSTFHSWCASVLREFADRVPIDPAFTIRDEGDKDDLLKHVAIELGKTGKKPGEVGAWASKPLHPSTRKRLTSDPQVMGRYRQLLREASALDFDMLEGELLRVLRSHVDVRDALVSRWFHVLVDEYQDTSGDQQAILDALAPHNLFVVGDLSQSIYRFRGAEPQGFVEFGERAGVRVLDLPINYRSVLDVVRMANACAARMAVPGVEMGCGRGSDAPAQGPGAGVLAAPDRDALFAEIVRDLGVVAGEYLFKRCAILSPTWDLLERLSPALEAAHIPHRVARRRLDVWETEEARWAINLLRLAVNPWDDLALRAALAAFRPRVSSAGWAMARGQALRDGCPTSTVLYDDPSCAVLRACPLRWPDGVDRADAAIQVMLPMLSAELASLHLHTRVTGLEALAAASSTWCQTSTDPSVQALLTWYAERRMTDPEVAEDTNEVTLTTIHGAKGLEWPCVWVLGCEAGRLPRDPSTLEDLEESRRLFYVALTRARDRLRLCVARHREPSPFVREVTP